MDIIEAAIAYVRELFEGESSGHDSFHTMRVYRTAAYLAGQERADAEITRLAALLHDVDDRKLSPETSENLDRATAFLKAQGVEPANIERICKIIREVSFAGEDSVVSGTIEGKCVQDADRLDALGAIGIARTFAYGGSHHRPLYDPAIPPKQNMTKEEYYTHVSTSLNHFYEKLFLLEGMMNTSVGKKLARSRTDFMRAYVDEFLQEWDGRR